MLLDALLHVPKLAGYLVRERRFRRLQGKHPAHGQRGYRNTVRQIEFHTALLTAATGLRDTEELVMARPKERGSRQADDEESRQVSRLESVQSLEDVRFCVGCVELLAQADYATAQRIQRSKDD